MKKRLPPTSYRLSDETRRLLALIAARLNISQRAVLELAIRSYARREGVK